MVRYKKTDLLVWNFICISAIKVLKRIAETSVYCSAAVGRFFLENHKKNKKCCKLDIFYDNLFSRSWEKIHHIQGQRSSTKFAYGERGCKLILVRMHIDYLFPIGNENLISLQHCAHFILSFEFWISIYNERSWPILDHYENQTIQISLCVPLIFAKGSNFVFAASKLFQIR